MLLKQPVCTHVCQPYLLCWVMHLRRNVQCNLSKPTTLGTKETVQLGEVSGLERFYMYSKSREQDKNTSSLGGGAYYKGVSLY